MKRLLLFISAALLSLAATSCKCDPQKALKTANPAAGITTVAQARTLNTLKNESDSKFYYLDYKADYKLDALLEQGSRSQKEIFDFITSNLLTVSPIHEEAEPACSAFKAVTPDGDVIYGRNLDFKFTYTLAAMLRTNPGKGAHKSLGIAGLQFLKMPPASLDDGKCDISPLIAAPYVTLDGMNDSGVAFSVLALSKGPSTKQFDTGRKDISTTVAIRYVLDRATSVDNAIELLSNYNMFAKGAESEKGSYHFLLADAGGKCVVLEYILPEGETSSVMKVIEADCVTNGYLTEGWDEVCNGGADRLKTLRDRLAETGGVLTEEEAMQLLSSVSRGLNPEELTSNTHWSVVYNLTKKTATVCVARDFDNPIKYSLK